MEEGQGQPVSRKTSEQLGAEYLSLVQELMESDSESFDMSVGSPADVGRNRTKEKSKGKERTGRPEKREDDLSRKRSRSTGGVTHRAVTRQKSILGLLKERDGTENSGEEAENTRSFGRPLAALLRGELMRNRRLCEKQKLKLPVPSVLYTIVEHMRSKGLAREQGLFRKSGRHTTVLELQEALDACRPVDGLLASADACTVADLLKSYLMQLPSPVVPPAMYPHFHAVVYFKLDRDAKKKAKLLEAGVSPEDIEHTLAGQLQWVELLASLVAAVPVEARAVLCYLLDFLVEVSLEKESNLMGSKNLSTVFSPAVFGSLDPDNVYERDSESGEVRRKAIGPQEMLQDVRDKSYVLETLLEAWPYVDMSAVTPARVYEATSSQPVPRKLSVRASRVELMPFPFIKGDIVIVFYPMDPSHPTTLYAELCHSIGVVHTKQLLNMEKVTFEYAASKHMGEHVQPFSPEMLSPTLESKSQPAGVHHSDPPNTKKKHKRSKSSVVGKISIFG